MEQTKTNTPGQDKSQETPLTQTVTVHSEPEEKEQAPEQETQPKPKVLFSRDKVRPSFTVGVVLPHLFPDCEPIEFQMRYSLTDEAQDRREEYLAKTPFEQVQTEKAQQLDELCDLLVSMPDGIGDLKFDGVSPGSSFKSYVQTSNAEQQEVLHLIVKGALAGYRDMVSPRSFRKEV